MPKTKYAKISISMPRDLLDQLEELSGDRGETRSELIAMARERLLREERERQIAEEYRRAYQRYPLTRGEIAWIESALESSADYIADEYPWDEAENASLA